MRMKENGADEPLWLHVEDAAKTMNVSRAFAYRLVLDGTIPSVKIGAARRIPKDALLAWMRQQVELGRQG